MLTNESAYHNTSARFIADYMDTLLTVRSSPPSSYHLIFPTASTTYSRAFSSIMNCSPSSSPYQSHSAPQTFTVLFSLRTSVSAFSPPKAYTRSLYSQGEYVLSFSQYSPSSRAYYRSLCKWDRPSRVAIVEFALYYSYTAETFPALRHHDISAKELVDLD
jgi:hypothetical protein